MLQGGGNRRQKDSIALLFRLLYFHFLETICVSTFAPRDRFPETRQRKQKESDSQKI